MASGAEIFAQMGARPRSFDEYAAAADQRQANALALDMGRIQKQNALQAMQDDLMTREASKAFGTDYAANANALRQQGLYKQAQAYEKAALDAQEAKAGIGLKTAQTGKASADAQKAQMETFLKGVGIRMDVVQNGTSPDALMAGLTRAVQAGYMTPQEAQQSISDMPRDPAQFNQWRDGQLKQGMEIGKRLEYQLKANNELVGPDGAVNQTVLNAKKDIARAGSSSTNVSYGAPVAGVDEKNNPVFFQPSKGGGAPAIVPGVRPNPKKEETLTEGQAKANLFGTRMLEADKIINDLAQKGVTAPSIAQQLTGSGGVAGSLATAVATPEQQQVDQAQRDFINAVLRRESGAAISPSEFENAKKQYFVQPGDRPEVIAQKARNRQTATQGMLAEVPESKRGIPSTREHPPEINDLLKKYRGK